MSPIPDSPCSTRSRLLLASALVAAAFVASGCRGLVLAEPGQLFQEERTSLKGGTVSRSDAAMFDAYYRAAEGGDREAQTLVGLMLQTGQGVPRNEAESARWFRKAALANECAAQYHLGLLYLGGRGVVADLDRATYWLRHSAEHRIEVQESSFRVLYRSVLGLGGIWPRPPFVEIPQSSSVEDDGAREARALDVVYERGRSYLDGDRVPTDPAHAVRFFRMAANDGHARAQLALGTAYRDGRGAKRDPLRAHMWLNISASGGSVQAREELAALEASLGSEEIAAAEFLAAEWHARHRP